MKQDNCFAPQGTTVTGLSKAAEGHNTSFNSVDTNPIDQLINRKRDINEDFLCEVYDSDVIPGDTEYYTGDSYVDMEANEFLASTAVMIMAYTPTREILAKQALKSENSTMYVTHVSRLVSLMFGGTMTSVNTDDENDIVNVARKIFFMLDDMLG